VQDVQALAEGPQLARRISRRLGAACTFSNLDGAVFVFVYLSYVVPSAGPTDLADVLRFAGFMFLMLPIGAVLSKARTDRALAWLVERRPATDEERRATLRLPFHLAAISFAGWIVAAAVFGLLELGQGGGTVAIRVVMVTIDGGLVCSTVAFLLTERVMRPAFALALAGRANAEDCPTRLGVRPRLLLTWLLGSGIPLLGLAGLPIANKIVERPNLAGAVLLMSIAGLLVGGLVTVIAAKSVADPLSEIRGALAKVEAGDLDVQVSVDDGGEIGQLQAGVNSMVAGLRERARLADLFGKHVGQEVAERALEQGTGLESELREASALFVDLIGSTAMAEVLPPATVVETLNAYFGTVVRVAAAEGGWVNKFEGDGALCVFGTPATQPDHAARALRTARLLHEELSRLSNAHPGLDAAIGVSSGQVVAGNVGTESRYEYTVIGRPGHWAALGSVALRGQQNPTDILEPASSVATAR
jgi:adenylate cyclase